MSGNRASIHLAKNRDYSIRTYSGTSSAGRGRGRGQTAAHDGCDVDEEDCAVVVDKNDCEVVRKDEEEVSFFAKQILTDLEQQQRIKGEQIRQLSVYETHRPRNRKNIIPRSPTLKLV